jgi:hypothetical protein
MLWIKKGIVGLLSLVLLISLLGLAFSTSLNMAFSQPKHLTNWVEQSNFYGTLTNLAVNDASKAVGSSSDVSNLQGAIRQSFVTTYPKSQFDQDISSFINSNYAWLKGKTSTPNFSINISQIKSNFASKIGAYYIASLSTLPACSITEDAALQNANPLTLTCRPPVVSTGTIKSQIVSKIDSSSIVVSKPVLDANNVLQRKNGEPYYTKVNASMVYKHLMGAPVVFAVLALVCIVCIFFGSIRKTRALRKISGTFLISGLVLLVLKLLSDTASSRITHQVSKNSTLSQFQTPVQNLAREIVRYLGKIDMWFGIIYLIIALIIIGLLHERLKMICHKALVQAQLLKKI